MADKPFPVVSGSYRYDIDYFSYACNGTDTFADDVVNIRSDGSTVTFVFKNEMDDPIGTIPLLYDMTDGLHYRTCPFGEVHFGEGYLGELLKCHNNDAAGYKPLVIDVLECAISLETDPAKASALKQILTIIRSGVQTRG